MTLQEAEKRLSELNGEINRLLKERDMLGGIGDSL